MPLIAVTYAKGRPGATTTALGLAAVAPAQARAVVVECDAAGGDLLRRHRLAARPSVVDFAAAARGATNADEVFTAGTQALSIGDATVPVMVAPAGGAQTRAALPELSGAGRRVLTTPDRLVLADCGRLEAVSPVWPLLHLADVAVVLARARADELAHVREHLGGLLDAEPGRLIVLLAPGGVYAAADVTDVLRTYVAEELARDPDAVTVLGPLPYDRKAAAVLGGELLAGRQWRRLPLLCALDRLLADLVPPVIAAPEPTVDDHWRTQAR
jgi:hypothetical protein